MKKNILPFILLAFTFFIFWKVPSYSQVRRLAKSPPPNNSSASMESLGSTNASPDNVDSSMAMTTWYYKNQEMQENAEAVSANSSDKRSWAFIPKRITGTQNFGKSHGFGDTTNFTSLQILFAPEYKRGQILPMVDLRGHYKGLDNWAANVGIIARYIPKSTCLLFGLNVYYDFRTGRKTNFNEIGVGMEILGKRWDFRANGYFPVGGRVETKTCTFDNYEGGYFMKKLFSEFAYKGANAEVGFLAINKPNFFLYIAGGPYYYDGLCKNFWGGEVRMRPQFRDYLYLDLKISHDSVFDTVFQATLGVTFPIYELSKWLKGKSGPCGITNRQVYQQVERNDIIPIGNACRWRTNF